MQILGSGMSARMWEITVDHARTCTLSNQLHLYYSDNLQNTGVVFDVIGELMGILNDHKFVSVNDLTDVQKVGFYCIFLLVVFASSLGTHDFAYQADAKMLVKQAIQNGDNVLAFDIADIMGVSSQAFPTFPPPSQLLAEDIYCSYSSPIKADDVGGFSFSAVSSPDIFVRGLDVFSQQTSTQCLDSSYEPESHGSILHSSTALEKISIPHDMLGECRSQEYFGENLHFYNPDISFLSQAFGIDSQADLGSAVASFITRSRWSPYALWGILLLVLKWRFSIKKKVATKKITTPHEDRLR
ncbi:hypothetical protein KSP40_PGU000969 [Platanthera guangdongensis]|uniref:Uncharacterized protein n=1 Tax=Platanthera guangdongensis TaxID=2320717 RepID=A0ABR2MMT9_9ASPA